MAMKALASLVGSNEDKNTDKDYNMCWTCAAYIQMNLNLITLKNAF